MFAAFTGRMRAPNSLSFRKQNLGLWSMHSRILSLQ
uniref:Uncharacterized protein n=1 Tax=Rhizophora mucronata TaxID=61149 RepID=A0A2P2N7A1_RHIMU